jgi:deoxyribodipyrimidine photo-lyase
VTRGIHWFRNDLRLHDNTALEALVSRVDEWLPVFVIDPRIAGSGDSETPRVRFLLDCVDRLGRALEKRGVPLIVRAGRPDRVLPRLLRETRAELLSFNEDVTPFARQRDEVVRRRAEKQGVQLLSRVDHVVLPAAEVRTGTGTAYSVYSPYRKTWWRRWHEAPRRPIRMSRLPPPIPGFSSDPLVGSRPSDSGSSGIRLPTGGEEAGKRRLDRFLETAVGRYHEDRDRPDRDGTSRLSPYLRFGAISVRRCFERAEEAAAAEPSLRQGIAKWLDELIWREFYSAILEENPRVMRESHRPEYEHVVWNDDLAGFEAWCDGRTGFPFVDAGMRQLRATGWMHNRARMVVASFLSKDLLIDWREGERFFFEHLVDGDPASNNGGWQWAASTGTDAQPYFRIFNPIAQGRRWDPEGRYVRRWVPELRDLPDAQVHAPWEAGRPVDYPPPRVDHAERRVLAIERYRDARQRGEGG